MIGHGVLYLCSPHADFVTGTVLQMGGGLHALVAGHQLCRTRGHELKVIPGPANVQRLFELTGMNDILPFGDLEPVLENDQPSSDEPAPSA